MAVALSMPGIPARALPSASELALTARIARKLTQDHLVRQAAYVLANEAVADTDGYALPAATATGAGPTGGGVIPAASAAPKTDGYGVPLGYCAWDNGSVTNHAGRLPGSAQMSAVTLAVVSAGADNQFQTTCAQIAAGQVAQGDDHYLAYSAGQILAGVQGSLSFADSVATAGDLAALSASSLKDGQVRLVRDTNQLYRYRTTSGWAAITALWQAGATAGDIYYAAGRVALGKQDATYTLDARGAVRADATEGLLVGNGAGGNVGQLSYDAINRRLTLETRGDALHLVLATGSAERMRLTSDGKLGIGTSNPAHAVDVRGSIRADAGSGAASGLFLADGAGANLGQLWYDPASTALTLAARGSAQQLVLSTGSNPSMRITSAGDVGIGLAAAMPAARLDVNGNVNVTGALTLSGAASFAGAVSAPALSVGGVAVSPASYVQKTGDTMSGALTIDNNLWVAGTGTFNQSLIANGGVDAGLVGPAAAGSSLALRSAGTTQMTIDSSGNVGIATAPASSSKLLVKGVVRAVGTGASGGYWLADDAGTDVAQLWYSSNASNTRATLEARGSTVNLAFAVNGSERMRIHTGGNVGIGTTNPVEKLDVSGAIRANSAGNAGGILLADNVGVNKARLWFGSGTPSKVTLDALGASMQLALSTNSTERVLIDSSGNVGIGTSSPGAKLDVGGTLSASGLVSANAGLSATTGSFSGALTANSVITDLISASGNTALVVRTNSVERVRIDNSGNLGVGTTSPAARLHVLGGSGHLLRVSDGAVHLDAGTVATSAAYLGTQSNHALALRTNNLERLRIDASGNVGIGTVSPSAKLDVAGTLTASDLVTANGGLSATTGTFTGALTGTTGSFSGTLAAAGLLSANGGVSATTGTFSGALTGTTATFSGSASAASVITSLIGPTTAAALSLRTSGTTQVTIDSSGNVGIGAPSPSSRLDVNGNVRASGTVRADTATGFYLGSGGVDVGQLWFSTFAPKRLTLEARGADVNLGLATNGSERLRIDVSGNVGIGKSNPMYMLDVAGVVRVDSGGAARGFYVADGSGVDKGNIWYDSGYNRVTLEGVNGADVALAAGGSIRLYVETSTGNVGVGRADPGYRLDVAGQVRATGFISSSDARLKRDIVPLDTEDVLRRFLQVRPVHYRLNATGEANIGYIAQELLPIFPEMVSQGSDGMYAVQYTQMLPILTSVVQHQQRTLDRLQTTKLDNLVGQWSLSSDQRGRFLFDDHGRTTLKGYGDTPLQVRNGDDVVIASFGRQGDLALQGRLQFNGAGAITYATTGMQVGSDAPGQIVVNATRAARAMVRLQVAPDVQAANARVFGSLFGDDSGVGLSDGAGQALLTARTAPDGAQVAVHGVLMVGDGKRSELQLAGHTAVRAPGDGSLLLAASQGVRVVNPATQETAVTLGADGVVQAKSFIATRTVDAYSPCSGQAGAIARDASGQLVVCAP